MLMFLVDLKNIFSLFSFSDELVLPPTLNLVVVSDEKPSLLIRPIYQQHCSVIGGRALPLIWVAVNIKEPQVFETTPLINKNQPSSPPLSLTCHKSSLKTRFWKNADHLTNNTNSYVTSDVKLLETKVNNISTVEYDSSSSSFTPPLESLSCKYQDENPAPENLSIRKSSRALTNYDVQSCILNPEYMEPNCSSTNYGNSTFMSHYSPLSTLYGINPSSYYCIPTSYRNICQEAFEHLHGEERSKLDSAYNLPSYSSQSCNRSPIDVLHRVFPKKRRNEIEIILHRSKGNVMIVLNGYQIVYNPVNLVF
ncbi:uncharacterized protein LOC106643779 [Copidosoma floridanum]|uniref:uncharacterized protein LOC106643779 n=1 Tax=Copidosoma floridanum TaxID=29053 RepID=UPI0006C9E376|nr:uncharacterized protein LOC106643779 [Copidosoma floridanum]